MEKDKFWFLRSEEVASLMAAHIQVLAAELEAAGPVDTLDVHAALKTNRAARKSWNGLWECLDVLLARKVDELFTRKPGEGARYGR